MPGRPQSSPGEGKRRTPTSTRRPWLRPRVPSPFRRQCVSTAATHGYTQTSTNPEVAGEMSALEERPEDEAYGAAVTRGTDDAREQDQPQTREPASGEEAEQDNYANTDDAES